MVVILHFISSDVSKPRKKRLFECSKKIKIITNIWVLTFPHFQRATAVGKK